MMQTILRSDLQLMADKALRACPSIAYVNGGTRAEHGAALLQEGAIVVKSAGVWSIGAHTVTRSTCSCDDRGAPVTTAGTKLCKHVYAVLMLLASERSSDALCEFLQGFAPAGMDAVRIGLPSPSTVIYMTVEWDYTKPTRHIVKMGHPMVTSGIYARRTLDDALPVTFIQMGGALARLGWSLVDLPQKRAGGFMMDYIWKLRPDVGGMPLTEDIWEGRGQTPETEQRATTQRHTLQFAHKLLENSAAIAVQDAL